MLAKEKTWKRFFNTKSKLSQNRTEKQIMLFKTTVNCLFNIIWCYLVIGCFDKKIGIFQQTVVRGLLKDLPTIEIKYCRNLNIKIFTCCRNKILWLLLNDFLYLLVKDYFLVDEIINYKLIKKILFALSFCYLCSLLKMLQWITALFDISFFDILKL